MVWFFFFSSSEFWNEYKIEGIIVFFQSFSDEDSFKKCSSEVEVKEKIEELLRSLLDRWLPSVALSDDWICELKGLGACVRFVSYSTFLLRAKCIFRNSTRLSNFSFFFFFFFLIHESSFCIFLSPPGLLAHPYLPPSWLPALPLPSSFFWQRSPHRSACWLFSVAVVGHCSSYCVVTNVSHFLWRSLVFLSFSVGECLSLLSDPWLSLFIFVSYSTTYSSVGLKE